LSDAGSSAGAWLRNRLAHPLARGRDLDDPSTTALRRRIIAEKPPLADIYREWYAWLNRQLPSGHGRVLELGSGAGSMRDAVPGVITSDIFAVPGIDLMLDAQRLPFADGSLRGIVMTNVLHHVPDLRLFFREARRCVRPGGVVAMIEPWRTPWSSFVYRRLHHEPFAADARDWTVGGDGPLSDANGALPWIVFSRDRQQFEREFPEWRISRVEPLMPLRYLLSGGVSLRSLVPAWTFGAWKRVDRFLERWPARFAMFAGIALEKR
jgi:SAM-dependent methyltransferase